MTVSTRSFSPDDNAHVEPGGPAHDVFERALEVQRDAVRAASRRRAAPPSPCRGTGAHQPTARAAFTNGKPRFQKLLEPLDLQLITPEINSPRRRRARARRPARSGSASTRTSSIPRAPQRGLRLASATWYDLGLPDDQLDLGPAREGDLLSRAGAQRPLRDHGVHCKTTPRHEPPAPVAGGCVRVRTATDPHTVTESPASRSRRRSAVSSRSRAASSAPGTHTPPSRKMWVRWNCTVVHTHEQLRRHLTVAHPTRQQPRRRHRSPSAAAPRTPAGSAERS